MTLRSLDWIALWLIALASPVTFSTASNVDVTAPVVDLGYAQYQGYFDTQTNITSFLSIRYAAPPVGKLRFQAPQAPLVESSVQPATQNPDMCYQTNFGTNTTAPVSPYGVNKRQSVTPAASEDCLFLNVFLPGTMPEPVNTTGGLPVLVWIHGGGYEAGYAAEFNGADLLGDSLNTGMVVVVIQYRLGAFGFLSGNEIKAQGALNAGLLDQTFALQWVQDHIGLFGGNKAQVLVPFYNNGGNTQPPLFNAAITSSTFLPSQYYYNDRVPQTMYNEIVSMTGCASSADTFTCLQSVDAETFQTANTDLAASVFYGTFIFTPVIDGTFILERPTVTLAKGQVNGQVLLAITNQNEGNIFVNPNETLTITDYVSQLFPDMSSFQVQEAAYIYQDYGNAVEQANMVMGESIFVCPTYYLLQTFTGRSWKGLFAIPPALHGQDSIYYFYSPSDPPPYDDPQFITAFAEPFMSLAKSADVNAKFDPTNITPYWDKYDIGQTEMLFNRTEAGVPVVVPIRTDPAQLQRCAFWSTVTSMTAQ